METNIKQSLLAAAPVSATEFASAQAQNTPGYNNNLLALRGFLVDGKTGAATKNPKEGVSIYGPTEAAINKSWKPGDTDKVNP